jgi:hypothetical protein
MPENMTTETTNAADYIERDLDFDSEAYAEYAAQEMSIDWAAAERKAEASTNEYDGEAFDEMNREDAAEASYRYSEDQEQLARTEAGPQNGTEDDGERQPFWAMYGEGGSEYE